MWLGLVDNDSRSITISGWNCWACYVASVLCTRLSIYCFMSTNHFHRCLDGPIFCSEFLPGKSLSTSNCGIGNLSQIWGYSSPRPRRYVTELIWLVLVYSLTLAWYSRTLQKQFISTSLQVSTELTWLVCWCLLFPINARHVSFSSLPRRLPIAALVNWIIVRSRYYV